MRASRIPVLLLGLIAAAPAFPQAPSRPGLPTETLQAILTPWEKSPQTRDQANSAFPAHKILGNVYYVGTADYASFLITSEQGHILVNPDFEDSVPIIQKNVEDLGFKFRDIKIILISHAHGDHCAGTAKVKEMTGAQFMVMDADADVMERADRTGLSFPAVKISRVLHDGEEVRFGGNTLVARLTPGHTKGCTTWTMKVMDGGKSYNAVIVGSAGVNDARTLVNNTVYPNIAEDYLRTFRTLRSLPCDLFLASHGSFFGLKEKYAKLKAGGPNPYLDAEGYRAHVNLMEQAYSYKLDWAARSLH